MTAAGHNYHFTVQEPGEGEIMGMGGPWAGSVYCGDVLVARHAMVGNLVADAAGLRLYFVRHYSMDKPWRWHHSFAICFVEVASGAVYEYARQYRALYLGAFDEQGLLVAYHSFHDKLPMTAFCFDTDEEPYTAAGALTLNAPPTGGAQGGTA